MGVFNILDIWIYFLVSILSKIVPFVYVTLLTPNSYRYSIVHNGQDNV